MQEVQKIKHARRMIQKPYANWTYTERMVLIKTRIKYDDIFNSENVNLSAGWSKVLADCSSKLASDKTHLNCIQQWNALITKYKSLFKLNISERVGHDASVKLQNREEWPYYNVIHQYAGKKDNFHPPYLIDNLNGLILNKSLEQDDHLLSSTINLLPRQSIQQSSTSTLNYATRPTPAVTRNQTPSTSQYINKSMSYDENLTKRKRQDCKIEKKIKGLLGILGHMIQKDYPDINVDALLTSSESDDTE